MVSVFRINLFTYSYVCRPEDLKNIDEMKLYKTAIKRKMPFHKWYGNKYKVKFPNLEF